MAYGPKPQPESVRFWRHVHKTDHCWLWTGGQNGVGYGLFRVGSTTDGSRRQVLAHRWAYQDAHGYLPGELDHLCRVRHCVRPSHLDDVTRRTNVLRGISPAAGHAKKSTCGICGAPYRATRKNSGSRVCTNARNHPPGRPRGLP